MMPDKCPNCGAGVAVEDGKPCRSETSAMYECYTSVQAGRDHRRMQSSCCVLREVPFLRARICELESVINDPEALWANWLRGTVRLPAGIGDVRAANDRVRELEERVNELEESNRSNRVVMAALQNVLEDAIQHAKEAKP